MNNFIILAVVFTVAIIVGIMGSSDYQEVASIRDQHNLQLTLDDCKRLFDAGLERDACFEKSIEAFGTDEQLRQWHQGYYSP